MALEVDSRVYRLFIWLGQRGNCQDHDCGITDSKLYLLHDICLPL
jgi:hypothetical protein